MVRSELLGVANTVPGVSLDIIENRKSISLVAKSIARFDRQFFRNRHINEGLHKWIRWTSAENKQKNDGLPIASLELDGPTRFFLKQSKSWFVARLFSLLGFDRISAMKTQSVYQQTGAFGLVTINDITPESFVMGGMVFQRIWLEATKAGLSLHPVTGFLFLELKSRFEPQNISKQQLAEIETSRKEIKEIMPSFVERTPIVFFRIGEAPAPSARSARIPVEITNAYCS